MAILNKVSKTKRQENLKAGVGENIYVRAQDFDPVVDRVNGITSSDGELNVDKGTVTQITAITTGVTLNKGAGVITTVSTTIAAGANAAFTVTNSKVSADSVIMLNVDDSASAGIAKLNVQTIAAGSFQVNISNIHALNAFNNTLDIHFLVV